MITAQTEKTHMRLACRPALGRPTHRGGVLPAAGGITLRKAHERDIDGIFALSSAMSSRGLLLSRSHERIRSMIPDFYVADSGDAVIGCGALTALAPGLGEISALAICDEQQGRGIGAGLVGALVDEGMARGFGELLAITYQTGFFTGLGFSATESNRFLEKIRREALQCPELEECLEPALHMRVDPEARRRD